MKEETIKKIRSSIQEKWDRKYPGLKLEIIWSKDDKFYIFRWKLPNFVAYGAWHQVTPEEIEYSMIPDTFIYKIEMMEKEFEYWAIHRVLKGFAVDEIK